MNQSDHNRLAFLTAEINENHQASRGAEAAMRASWVESVERALATGDGLKEAKRLVVHGEWMPWLKDNCPSIRKSWAEVYMRLALHRAYVEHRIQEIAEFPAAGILSVRGLDREITEMLQDTKQAKRRVKAPRDGMTVTQPGDFWVLGSHNLTCADSRIATDDWPLVNYAYDAELMLTDPPYGDERINGMANNHVVDWRAVWMNIGCDRGFVFHAGTKAKQVIDGLEAAGFEIEDHLTWLKRVGNRGKRLLYRHEPLYYIERAGTSSRWVKNERLKSVLEFDVTTEERKEAEGHDTPKPVELLKLLIKAASKRGDAILDPFAGSGSTLIACEKTGRYCTAIELEPFFCDVIIRRWQKLTGRHAELGGDIRYDDLVADPSLRRC